MRILIITESNPYLTSTATDNRLLSLVDGLKVKNVKIDFLLLYGFVNREEYKNYKNNKTFNSSEVLYLMPELFKIKVIKKTLRRIIKKRIFAKLLEDKIKGRNYDIIWLGFSDFIIEISIELFRLKLPVLFFHEKSEFSWIGLSNEEVHANYLNKFLPHIDIMSIMTKTLISYYKRFLSSTTIVVHLPMTVDFERFNLQSPTVGFRLSQPYIGYSGSINKKKDGVDILVKAFIHIMNEFPEYRLYLAGNQEPKDDYNDIVKIVEAHHATDRIVFLGLLDKEQIPTFLFNATILALARPASKQAEGGFPTKLGEYLATGNPVCLTKVGEVETYLKHNDSAFIVLPDSYITFAHALKEAITSPYAKEIGIRGKKVAKAFFNKDIQSEILFEIFSRTILNAKTN